MVETRTEMERLSLRMAELEARVGIPSEGSLSTGMFLCTLLLMVAGCGLALKSFGPPNHYYQSALAALILLLGYHRQSFFKPRSFQWILAGANFVFLSLVLKLAIGGGTRWPFHWLRYPDISLRAENTKLISVLPSWTLTWQPTDLALWSMDLTVVQCFLVLLMVMGSAVGFQLFASLTAFLLLVVSVPVLASFEWSWVFPSLLVGGLGLYLQMPNAPSCHSCRK